MLKIFAHRSLYAVMTVAALICAGIASANAQSETGFSADAYIAELTEKATRGEINAQRQLGLLHMSGTHVERDYEAAQHWLGKAAAGNDIEAQKLLGKLYADGIGTEKDLTKSLEYYQSLFF